MPCHDWPVNEPGYMPEFSLECLVFVIFITVSESRTFVVRGAVLTAVCKMVNWFMLVPGS
jgi:hypothetical protein